MDKTTIPTSEMDMIFSGIKQKIQPQTQEVDPFAGLISDTLTQQPKISLKDRMVRNTEKPVSDLASKMVRNPQKEAGISANLESKGVPQQSFIQRFGKNLVEPIRETAQDIGQGIKSFGQSSLERIKKAEKAFDEQGMMAGVGEFATQLTGGVQDVVGEGFMTALKVVSPEDLEQGASAVVSKLGEKAMTMKDPMTGMTLGSAIEQGLPMYEQWAKENPAKDRAVRASGNILLTVLDLVGFKWAGAVTEQGVKRTGRELLEQTAEQLVKSGDELVEQTTKQINSKKLVKQANKENKIIKNRVAKLAEIESANSPLRKYVSSQQAKGIDVKQNLASTDVLQGAVDNNGVLRTTQQGGAIEQYRDFLRPQEDIVTQILEQEGKTIKLVDLEKRMIDNLNNSKIKGSTKATALKRIKSEIDGLQLDATNGEVPLSIIQEAKIQKYSSLNYLNKESANSDKLIARVLKESVEESSDKSIKQINKELGEHYATIKFLEKLDGRRVSGGKLGKYFAQTVGAVAGSHFGPVGTLIGAEVGALAQGKIMGSTFKRGLGKGLQETPAIKQGLKDIQLNKSGNLNKAQTTSTTANKKVIKQSIAEPKAKVKKDLPKPAKSASIDGMEKLKAEAKKHKTADEFLKEVNKSGSPANKALFADDIKMSEIKKEAVKNLESFNNKVKLLREEAEGIKSEIIKKAGVSRNEVVKMPLKKQLELFKFDKNKRLIKLQKEFKTMATKKFEIENIKIGDNLYRSVKDYFPDSLLQKIAKNKKVNYIDNFQELVEDIWKQANKK